MVLIGKCMVKTLQQTSIETLTEHLLINSDLNDFYINDFFPEHIRNSINKFRKEYALNNIRYFYETLPEFYYLTNYDEFLDSPKKIKYLPFQQVKDNYYSVYEYENGIYNQLFISLNKKKCQEYIKKYNIKDFLIIREKDLKK
jgi:hypothetical protein